MPSLVETQSYLRRAMVERDSARIVPLLVGGRDPAKRLAIHQRNYETSLVNALLGKFPATRWLVGTEFLSEAARKFIQAHPPEAPCIAEYGENFPAFLAAHRLADRVPYMKWLAELEWHVGQVAIAIGRPALNLSDVSMLDPSVLPDATLTVQPGIRYLRTPWPVDELIQLYVTETAPNRLQLSPVDLWLEIRGARGEFQINHLDASEFAFRKAIQEGQTIGDAAELALGIDAGFDPGRTFAKVMTDGLVTAIE